MQNSNLKFRSFDEVLRTYLKRQEEEGKEKRDNNWWFASELGTCLRKQFLRRLGVNPVQKEFRIAFLAEQGKVIHDRMEAIAKQAGILVNSEYTLTNEQYRYKGRFDLLVNLGNGTDPYLSLIDIKTQRPEAFFRRAKLPEGQRVAAFQKKQLASYFYFARMIWPTIRDARIYYLDRGGGVREEYLFKFGKEAFKEVLDELETLNKYWQEKKLPPCSNSFVCRNFCKPLKKELLKVESGEISLEEFLKNHGQENKK